ncbi:hypothetical protein ACFL56_01050 [Candidatus Margulisiibacteriota bacterium]
MKNEQQSSADMGRMINQQMQDNEIIVKRLEYVMDFGLREVVINYSLN